MKRFLTVFLFMLIIGLPAGTASAKSYSIDEVQIRGWINPDGTMLVNELFTYSFDGEFSRLKRAFPAEHRPQIEGFKAFQVMDGNGRVGFIDDNQMKKLPVSLDKENWVTKIAQKDGTIQVMYIYYVQNAAVSYDTYSDLQLTFFEKGSNHDMDMNDVQISFILPEEAGEKNIHGYFYASGGKEPVVHSNGIQFNTPVSKANTYTAVRVLFPSGMMTASNKGKAPVSLEEAIAGEQQKMDEQAWKVAQIPAMKKITIGLTVFLGLIALFVFWMKSRLSGFFGSTDYVMKTDPLYLSFVDHSGEWFKGSFLAGLFSLVDKGEASVELADSAERFADRPDSPDKTLAFQLVKGKGDLQPFERTLAVWLFKGRLMKERFHLHDIAEGKESKAALRKQHKFEVEHTEWHDEVKDLLVESGTLSTRYSYVLRLFIVIAAGLMCAVAFYIGGGDDWGYRLVLPAIFFAVTLFSMKEQIQKWPSGLYFIVLLFTVNSLDYEELTEVFSWFVIIALIAFYLVPKTVLSSKTAFYTKMSINKFRRELKYGMPEGLPDDEQQQYLIRAYLLKPSKKKLPQVRRAETATAAVAMASLFTLREDPLQFVHSTWGPKLVKAGSSDGTSFDGGYSGGGGGDGGGGAGAD
ncbi:DUF2207 domain-containing protein [Sporosarcina cascadiensis]|uniref:DUF2207 domain-containing protein n=1 Tax=Sporosarcina cascadiensis TaxID=2660747 RepID=UPI001891209B|nr:DUF2207 domain-containing protein [Sporosarcina cascadiensis]